MEPTSNPSSNPSSKRKLFVLDLNKCLLYRPQGGKKTSFQPRPYIGPFMRYLFHPEIKARLDVMVWSSARLENVEKIVDRLFGPYKSSLVALWGREQMLLTPVQFEGKCRTRKDLALIWKTLPQFSSFSHPNTILLDDSPEKAIYQPFNHVCIPKYDKNRRHFDQVALLSKHGDMKVDEALLAIVGILDCLRDVPSVPEWIHAGGLWGGYQIPDIERMVTDPVLAMEVVQWFEDGPTFNAWVCRGRRALADLGIDPSESGAMVTAVKREMTPLPERSSLRTFVL